MDIFALVRTLLRPSKYKQPDGGGKKLDKPRVLSVAATRPPPEPGGPRPIGRSRREAEQTIGHFGGGPTRRPRPSRSRPSLPRHSTQAPSPLLNTAHLHLAAYSSTLACMTALPPPIPSPSSFLSSLQDPHQSHAKHLSQTHAARAQLRAILKQATKAGPQGDWAQAHKVSRVGDASGAEPGAGLMSDLVGCRLRASTCRGCLECWLASRVMICSCLAIRVSAWLAG